MNAARRARQKANKAARQAAPDPAPEVPAVMVQAGLATASGSVNDEERS